MKTLQRILLAASLLAGSLVSLRAEISPQAWLETYYLNPQPAEVPQAIQKLSRSGYFDRDENTAVAIGFLSTLFAKHPERVDGWFQQLSNLPERHQRLLAAALWQAGNPAADLLLQRLAQNSPVRSQVESLINLPAQLVSDVPVRSPSSLKLQWGAFLASGDERHIVNILESFSLNQPALNTATRLALAHSAAAHPRVMEICRAQLANQPAEIQAEMRAALNTVAPAPRT